MRADNGIDVCVTDDGIGFDVSRLDEIASPFRQSSGGLTRSHQGLGIGIPLSLAAFKLHDATVAFDSVVGKGTSVRVGFPPKRTLSAMNTASKSIASGAGQ